MPLITETYLARLEQLLGNAYDLIQGTQGDADTPGSVRFHIAEAKAYLRGGLRGDFGISPINSLDADDGSGVISVGTVSSTAGAFSIPTTKAYFGGLERYASAATYQTYTAGASSERIVNGVTYGAVGATYGNVLLFTVKDVSSVTLAAATIQIRSLPVDSVYGIEFLQQQDITPSYSTKELALGKYILDENVIPAAAPTQSMQPKVYFESAGDDDVEAIFEGLYATNAREASINRTTELTDTISELETHARSLTGLTWKAYWKSQGRQFTSSFTKLWAKAKSEQLSTNLGIAVPSRGDLASVASYTNSVLEIGSALEGYLLTQAGTGSTTLNFYSISPSYSKGMISHVLPVGQQEIDIYQSTDWPDSGHLWVKPDSFANVTGGRGVFEYTKPWSTMATRFTLGTTNEVFVDSWTDVYYVENMTMTVPSGSPTYTIVYTPSQSAKSLGVAIATISDTSTYGVKVLIRSR